MPRTRTKYIWPPPMLADDPATLTSTISRAHATSNATSEPLPKRPRIDSPSTTPHIITNQRFPSVQDGRQIFHSDVHMKSQEDHNNNNKPVEWTIDSKTKPPSLKAVFEAYKRIPMELQIKRYRDWRRMGSIHDDFCMMCHEATQSPILPCQTCRKSFHDTCMPRGVLYDEKKQWYCAVCVERKWHMEPPTLTPPASPSPPPIDRPLAEESRNMGRTDPRIISNVADRQGSATTTTTTSTGNPESLTILAEISRSVSRGDSRPSPSYHPSDIATYPRSPSVTAPSISARPAPVMMSSSSHYDSGSLAPPSFSSVSSTYGVSTIDSHARKSKFATLSSEVDSALWLLYRELESVTSLRQRIGELESEVVKLRQDVSIRDNQLILSRRSMAALSNNLPGGISQAELDRLRVQASKGEEAMRQLDTIRTKNDALERELADSRAESAAKDKTLNEWKSRLVSMIGN